ncbi:MAG TPA: lysylphosphatidylglycerol synthase transmembrane domain-containing protein [Candidatus Angelobacter sp.]|nr:lysylphosphatidylglycerol synthase transmembrane domain-containing protein [Candidatus Angelobacter sp.]
MSFHSKITIITLVLLAVVVFFGWDQMVHAWGLLGSVNLWVLSLLIPIQFFSYYAVGETMFSYFRAKGDLTTMSRWRMTRIALELNFVNHIVPVPSIAGFSYLGWILRHYGVTSGRATMAQIIRFATMFISLVFIIIIAVIVLTFDYGIDRTVIIISGSFITAAVGGTTFLIYMIGSHKRIVWFSGWLTRVTNKFMFKLTRGKKRQFLKLQTVENFFLELHQDYINIRRDKKILIRPFLWAILANLLDVLLILIAFLALGFWVNPATLFIACGLSSIAAVFAATPGGAGVYEAIMIAFLASAGIPADVAIAGTLLARAILFMGTIIFGYLFYQLTINKYGKISNSSNI